ncbi:MAG TPA: S1 RNA-binding domain-containing protein [Candidatus Magasanikbacteria bacterium]|jgi:small subunit ribosomal protein S1|nr:S1 RNA-binding domain-containing protein [Candidatus Magasanikbacteria bacterium]HQF57533.1 S1 RNA-binding domain-containing protein [Candidatus Magasanikbacteria bacterium]HQL52969.1 S1 RNA-binding domain-containing protein [Candidatus Magasanikbacteria bacterium]
MVNKKEELVDVAKNNFNELVKDFFAKLPKEGDLVKGKVISVDSGSVRLDIGGVAVGVIRGRELFSESKEFSNLKVGDDAEATVLEIENENGEMELSFRIAGHKIVWNKMKQWMDDNITVNAKVIAANKGGLMIQVDALVGFMPVSQLNPDHYPRVPGGDKNRILEHLKDLIGLDIKVKVIDVKEEDEKLIVSEKAVWEDEQKAVLDSFKVGDTVTGEVSALTSFGAFVKFGENMEGLVHISEIVWQRIDHPKDVLKVGDQVKAQIIDINKSKIYLSIRRLIDDPWKKVKDKYKVGQVIEAEIHKVEPFGLMIKLDDDIHGLAHLTELSDTTDYTIEKMKEDFKVGEKKKFEIISIEPSEHRLGLKLEGVKGKIQTKEEIKKEKSTKKEKVEEEKQK